MNDHLAAEILAEHAEGLLSPADAAAAEAHLFACEPCRRTYDDLVALPELLAADDPGPMPAELAARIDAALVSERAAAATVDLGAERARRARSRRWLQVGSVAAGLAVIGAGAVLGGQLVAERGSPDTVSGLARDEADSSAEEAGPPAASAAEPPVTASGRTYTAEGLPGQLRLLLPPADVRATAPLEAAPNAAREYGAGGADTAGLARCVDALGEGTTTPLAADTGRWTGRPALVVVLPEADETRVTVYVVDPACTAGKPEVLHHAELPRP
jgi:anti-sigma factor RsiW